MNRFGSIICGLAIALLAGTPMLGGTVESDGANKSAQQIRLAQAPLKKAVTKEEQDEKQPTQVQNPPGTRVLKPLPTSPESADDRETSKAPDEDAAAIQQASPSQMREVQLQLRDAQFPNATSDPQQRFFQRDRPVVIVLIHGKGGPCDGIRCHLAYARISWDLKFVRELVGRSYPALVTFSGVRLDGTNWPTGSYYQSDELPLLVPHVATDDHGAADGYPETWDNHFVARSAQERQLSVMLTYRNATQSLEDQARDALDQIFALYNRAFGSENEPQIILVAHSMGGLVSRYILSNPFRTQRDIFRANFVRNRTLFLVTLATPHDGSRLADAALELMAMLETEPPIVTATFDALQRLIPSYNEGVQDLIREFLSAHLGTDHPATTDLLTASVANFNRGILAPHRAARDDGTLVPIYALGSRSPAGGYLNSPTTDVLRLPSDVRTMVNLGGCVTFDRLLTTILENNWGRPPRGLDALDRVQRVSLHNLILNKAQEIEEGISNIFLKKIVDSMNGGLAISLAHLPQAPLPLYLNQEWTPTLASCPVRYRHWQCGEFYVPVDECSNIGLDCFLGFFNAIGYNLDQGVRCMDPRFIEQRWHLRTTVDVPCVGLSPRESLALDGEVDNDGLVNLDSAIGLRLGTNQFEYFDHSRAWQVPGQDGQSLKSVNGSWYRFYGPDDPWRLDNHGSIVDNVDVAKRIYHQLILGNAGPLPGRGEISTYPPLPTTQQLGVIQSASLSEFAISTSRGKDGSLKYIGKVELSESAGLHGAIIRLTSKKPELVQVPSQVSIARGAVSATFPVSVAARPIITTTRVTLIASYGTSRRETTLTFGAQDRLLRKIPAKD